MSQIWLGAALSDWRPRQMAIATASIAMPSGRRGAPAEPSLIWSRTAERLVVSVSPFMPAEHPTPN